MIKYYCDKCSHETDNENLIILNNHIGQETPMGAKYNYVMICHKCFGKLPATVHKLFLNFEYSIESLRERNLIIDQLRLTAK